MNAPAENYQDVMTDQEAVELLHMLNRYCDGYDENPELVTVFDLQVDLINSLPDELRQQWVAE